MYPVLKFNSHIRNFLSTQGGKVYTKWCLTFRSWSLCPLLVIKEAVEVSAFKTRLKTPHRSFKRNLNQHEIINVWFMETFSHEWNPPGSAEETLRILQFSLKGDQHQWTVFQSKCEWRTLHHHVSTDWLCLYLFHKTEVFFCLTDVSQGKKSSEELLSTFL